MLGFTQPENSSLDHWTNQQEQEALSKDMGPDGRLENPDGR